MSHQALARKWRPRGFDTLVGQDHVVRALSHALNTRRLHHAYLFTGTRGVGKTTLSRILAKALNCLGVDGKGDVTSQPCGVCRACTEIDGGRFVDYIEMDAASNRGVEEMTTLLEQAVYAPTSGRYKVYMIDEVHMLSNHAFNAMLKTLEEPPEHVKFILATTDPQKVPVTVLSRCLQFNLKQMTPAAVVEYLQGILSQEGIPFELPGLRIIGKAAQGSMRDGLSLLDQAIAYGGGHVSEEAVGAMLGAIDQSYLVRLLQALAKRDGQELIAIVDTLAARSIPFLGALSELASLLARIALVQVVPDAVSSDDPLYQELHDLGDLFDPSEVQLHYSIALKCRAELELAPDEYAGFVMALLRMLAFRPLPTVASTQALHVAPRPAARAVVKALPTAISLPDSSAHSHATQLTPAPKVSNNDASYVSPSSSNPAFDGDWPTLVGRLNIRGVAAQLASQSELVKFDSDLILLRVPVKTLAEGAAVERLKAVLSAHFGQPLRLEVQVGTVRGTTAHAVAQEEKTARLQASENELLADPFVQELMGTMGGSIVSGSIKSV